MTGGPVNPPAQPGAGELEDAFAVFSEVSNELVASYRVLETRVASLSQELAEARDERRLELKEKERLAGRLGLLLDALPGGVVVLDANGHVQECNPAARGLLGEPLHGALWREVVQRVFAPRPDDGHDISLRSGQRVNIATCSLGEEPGQVLLIKDVTETRWLQEQLAQLRRLSAMGEMAASLAHQIRTPLASALLYAGNLGRVDLEPDARQRFGDKLRGVLGHLEKLVKDMLAFARKGNFEVEDVSMSELESALVQMLETSVGGAAVNFDPNTIAAGLNRVFDEVPTGADQRIPIPLDDRLTGVVVQLEVDDRPPHTGFQHLGQRRCKLRHGDVLHLEAAFAGESQHVLDYLLQVAQHSPQLVPEPLSRVGPKIAPRQVARI